MIIAIDGLAGSGKSITAINVANKLNYIRLDTGAMYRAITFYLINNDIKLEKKNLSILSKIDLTVGGNNFDQSLLL